MDAEAARHRGIIDVRIGDAWCRWAMLLDAAAAAVGHRLQVHELLMIGAVVVHDVEHRDAVVRRRPQRAGTNMKSPSPPKASVRRPWRLLASAAPSEAGSVVADAGAARAAVPLVGLVEVPQPVRPGDADAVADQRPVLVLDLGIDLRAHARGRDRARVPAERGVGLRLLDHGEPCRRRASCRAPRRRTCCRRRSRRFTASMSAGSDASPSPAMARSTSW